MQKLLLAVIFAICSAFSAPTMAKTIKLKISKQGHPTAYLSLPASFSKRKNVSLLVNIHGYRGNALLQTLLMRLGKHQNKLNFAMLYPQATKDESGRTFWNASNFCCDFYKTKIEDKAYIKSLIEHVLSQPEYHNIDPKRVYLFGYSNGAFMAYSLACEMPEMIAGVAGFAGTMDLRDDKGDLIPAGDPCPNGLPMPIYHIHGTNDQTIKYDGHDNFPKSPTGHLSARQLVDNWLDHNQCNVSEYSVDTTNASLLLKGKETTIESYQECQDEVQVKFATIENAGHISLLRTGFFKSILAFLFQTSKK